MSSSGPSASACPSPPDPNDRQVYGKWFIQVMDWCWAKRNFYPPNNRRGGNTPVPMTSASAMATPKSGGNKTGAAVIPPYRDEDSDLFHEVQVAINNYLEILKDDGVLQCSCMPGPGGATCTDDTCVLRSNDVECTNACEGNCQNKRAMQNQFLHCIEYTCKDAYGKCLSTKSKIDAGTLIMEYIGEVTRGVLQLNQPHAYPITKFKGQGSKYMNTHTFGSPARLLQHSTDHPNCAIRESIVDGKLALLVHSIADIEEGEVLTICYPQRAALKYKRYTEEQLKKQDSARSVALKQVVKEVVQEVVEEFQYYPKFKTTEAEPGVFKCNYGYCQKKFRSQRGLDKHKAKRHHTIVPEFTLHRDNLYDDAQQIGETLLYHENLADGNLDATSLEERKESLEALKQASDAASRARYVQMMVELQAEERRLMALGLLPTETDAQREQQAFAIEAGQNIQRQLRRPNQWDDVDSD